jgi:hypothetical protein
LRDLQYKVTDQPKDSDEKFRRDFGKALRTVLRRRGVPCGTQNWSGIAGYEDYEGNGYMSIFNGKYDPTWQTRYSAVLTAWCISIAGTLSRVTTGLICTCTSS